MNDELKTENVFPQCTFKVVDGHIEADCPSKEAGHYLAELLEQEVTIRVKPGQVTQE